MGKYLSKSNTSKGRASNTETNDEVAVVTSPSRSSSSVATKASTSQSGNVSALGGSVATKASTSQSGNVSALGGSVATKASTSQLEPDVERRLRNVATIFGEPSSRTNIVLSEKFLKNVALEIGAEWQLLFISLGLTNSEIEHIDYDRGIDQATKNLKALLLWRKKNKTEQAFDQLHFLLYGLNEMRRQDLVDKYTGYLEESNLSQICAYESCDDESDLKRLTDRLVETYVNITREIPMSPVQADCDKLPIEQLFSAVDIREDAKDTAKGKQSTQDGKQQERRELKNPDDMLTKNDKEVPRVFMLGDAAHGKTTYCMWLLRTWCITQIANVCASSLSKWGEALSKFDFVFYLPLRHVHPSRSHVADMICQNILGSDTALQNAAKQVLSNDKYRCFIIIDGLDEWKPDASAISKLMFKGMPNTDDISNCVIFTTMRPWKLSEVAEIVRYSDRLIELQGLSDEGINDVIHKVLVHYHKKEQDTVEYEKMHDKISSRLKNETVQSFTKIPLLAVVCVQIWCSGNHVGESMTSFYIAMVNMLIQRALKHDSEYPTFEEININLPKVLSAKKYIRKYMHVLSKLGKVAYESLLSKGMEFPKDDLETEIGEKELWFALHVGLISQRNVHSAMEEKVSVHFFHISVQEFLAAIYIVIHREVINSFLGHLSEIKVIMELSNVIMFICGLCPSLAQNTSIHVGDTANRDTDISTYRELLGSNNETVKELYKLQASWYNEFLSTQEKGPLHFNVSDIYLHYSDTETVRVTRKLLSDRHVVGTRSLRLHRVPTDEVHGITNEDLNKFLCDIQRTRSLMKVTINGEGTNRSLNRICGSELRTLHLLDIKMQESSSLQDTFISHMDSIQMLYMYNVTVGNRNLGLVPNMSMLQKITFVKVRMTPTCWNSFVQSVIDIDHQFNVSLNDTNIDVHSRSTIFSSTYLSVTWDEDDVLEFIRVRP